MEHNLHCQTTICHRAEGRHFGTHDLHCSLAFILRLHHYHSSLCSELEELAIHSSQDAAHRRRSVIQHATIDLRSLQSIYKPKPSCLPSLDRSFITLTKSPRSFPPYAPRSLSLLRHLYLQYSKQNGRIRRPSSPKPGLP